MSLLKSRRMFLASIGALSLGLAGCNKTGSLADSISADLNGADLSGLDFGRDFRLTDPDGRDRGLADFRGKAVMVFFGFTQCPDICPTALFRATEIKRLLGDDADALQVIFITIDPERDTPEVLRQYVGAFDPAFLGLYGDMRRTRETATEFKAFYQKVPTGGSYTMDHTTISFVFDARGKLRLGLGHALSADECAEDIRHILSLT
ncbi:MAG TPA: SCO family protein [Candidimonas sp.]|nr:SCO family protein [Candidimonas sp.]